MLAEHSHDLCEPRERVQGILIQNRVFTRRPAALILRAQSDLLADFIEMLIQASLQSRSTRLCFCLILRMAPRSSFDTTAKRVVELRTFVALEV